MNLGHYWFYLFFSEMLFDKQGYHHGSLTSFGNLWKARNCWDLLLLGRKSVFKSKEESDLQWALCYAYPLKSPYLDNTGHSVIMGLCIALYYQKAMVTLKTSSFFCEADKNNVIFKLILNSNQGLCFISERF